MDSGFMSVKLGFWIPVVSGIQIPWAVFHIPKPRILDSTRRISRIPDYKSKIFPDSGIPYMRRYNYKETGITRDTDIDNVEPKLGVFTWNPLRHFTLDK